MRTTTSKLNAAAARNKRDLIYAASELLKETSAHELSIGQVAERAGLSQATAYRSFSSLDSVLKAFLYELFTQLRNYSDDSILTGVDLYDDVLREWTRIISTYGSAMTKLRSMRGLIERVHERDPHGLIFFSAWERPIRALLRSLDVSDEHLPSAIALHNAVFSPRDVIDHAVAGGLGLDGAISALRGFFVAGISSWSDQS